MSDLVRLSLSLEEPLLKRLEGMVRASGYTNRSEFIRDMIRQRMVEQEWEQDREVVGTVTLVYDHHARQLTDKLTGLQHTHHDNILATTHVHLDRHMCAEMILAKGPASRLRKIAELLHRQKGVLHATLSLSSTGQRLM